MVDGVLGAEEQGTLQPALLAAGEGLREFCYIVEDHGDGELTILVPWAPTAFAGSVKIVDAQLVQKIEPSWVIPAGSSTILGSAPGNCSDRPARQPYAAT